MLTHALDHAIAQSDRFLARHQDADGGWRVAPDARVLENALTLMLCGPLLSSANIERARATLAGCQPQTHSPLAQTVDEFLLGRAVVLDMTAPEWMEAAAKHRRLFFAGLGHALGWRMAGAPDRASVEATLLVAVEQAGAREMKRWTTAECCALLIMLGHRRPELLAPILKAQDPEGSFGMNPLSTALVVAALAQMGVVAASALAGGLRFLEAEVDRHGSWRFAMAEVWDTALTLRVLAERKFERPAMLARAAAFVAEAQSPDGGWPYRQGVESDTDTTGMALYALRLCGVSEGSEAAVRYLRARQTADGLWRTWHDTEDPPAEDAIAHAVLGLMAHGHDDVCGAAKRFLIGQCHAKRGWSAHWYNSETYSACEIVGALGRRHPISRYVVQLVLQKQRTDGGWAPGVHRTSTPAATGSALGLLVEFLSSEDERVQAGIAYLCAAQGPDGRFGGATDMYAPRPFAVDYTIQTEALALTGITRWANKLHDARRVGQRGAARQQDYLAVAFDAARMQAP